MQTLKLFWRDMRIGTFRNMVRFLMIPIVVVLMSAGFTEYVMYLYEEGITTGLGTSADYYLNIMQGMYIYKFTPESEFLIPISWFVLHIGMAYITAYYPYKDYCEYGKTVFMASGSRVKWWLAKIFWCMASVALYYVVIMISCTIVAYMNGADIRATWSEDIMVKRVGDAMMYVSEQDIMLIAVIVPFVTSVVLSEFQMLLSFCLTPVVSFAITCGIYIVSAYYTCWWLPGNYTMWIRSSYIEYEGIRPESGLLLALFGFVCVIVSGTVFFREKDVLENRIM